MIWFRAFLAISLTFGFAQASSKVWAQDEEIELEDGDDFADEAEDVSFDDFGEEDPVKNKSSFEAAPESAPTDGEMNLEPLEGTEDQVGEVPEDKAPLLKIAPESDEFTPPPPPTVAEPDTEPTPEPTAQPVDDTPDLDLEARLYDIYINYHSKKLSGEEWSALIGERESETYSIQRGDTLWSISKTFFNDGNYWPKIWQLNSAITNPHLIQPGNSIRFLLGTESETPAFSVTEANQEPLEIPSGDGGALSLTQETTPESKLKEGAVATGVDGTPSDEVEIPPPSENYNPVLKKLPPSIPEWFLQRKGLEYDDLGVDYGRRKIADLQDKKYLESFVDDEHLKADGDVREIEGGATTAANFQYVFIGLPRGAGKTGEIYTVIERTGKLKRVNEEVATVNQGYQYRIQGEVILQDFLSSIGGNKPQDIYRALVKKTLNQIHKGSFVVKGALPTISLEAKGEKNDALTQIVGAHQIELQKTLSLHTLAYLSGGKSNGLEAGQLLTVRANTKLRNPESLIAESYIPVGQLKVLRVGERFSTAVVIKVWDAMFVGDVTGAGKVLPPLPPERQKSGAGVPVRAQAPGPTPSQNDFEVKDEGGSAVEGDNVKPDGSDEFDNFDELEEDVE